MFCSRCQAKIPDGALFCPRCGAGVSNQVPQQQTVARGAASAIGIFFAILAAFAVICIVIVVVNANAKQQQDDQARQDICDRITSVGGGSTNDCIEGLKSSGH